MRALLHSQEICGIVIVGYLDSNDQGVDLDLSIVELDQLRDNRNRGNKDLGVIREGLDDMIFTKVSNVQPRIMAWDILYTIYQGVSKVKTIKLQNLRGDFETLKMKESECVDNFMTYITNIV